MYIRWLYLMIADQITAPWSCINILSATVCVFFSGVFVSSKQYEGRIDNQLFGHASGDVMNVWCDSQPLDNMWSPKLCQAQPSCVLCWNNGTEQSSKEWSDSLGEIDVEPSKQLGLRYSQKKKKRLKILRNCGLAVVGAIPELRCKLFVLEAVCIYRWLCQVDILQSAFAPSPLIDRPNTLSLIVSGRHWAYEARDKLPFACLEILHLEY